VAAKIMVVEDDPDFLHLVQFALEHAGFLVITASSGQSAVRWLREPGSRPDLFILDIGLPDPNMDGLALCKALKKDAATRKVPVIIVSGFADNARRIEAVQVHADLVLSKPVVTSDLIEAVRAMLELPRPERRGLLHRGGLELDPETHSVFFNGRQIQDLGLRLFDLLYLLADHCPNPLSPRYILDALKLKTRDGEVAVMVSRLRGALREEFGLPFIVTVPNEGYRLEPPVPQTARLP
jgi:two-component system phosphate regulon response regulator PhoB